MKLTFKNLFFVKKEIFPTESRLSHEAHHRKVSWSYYATIVLGFWLIAGPPTFGYQTPEMIWNDVVLGFALIFLSYFALKPYNLWAQWAIVFIGIWLFIAPMVFWAKEGAALLNDFLIGTLVVAFGILIPKQPGIKLFEQPGPNIPPGWSYNPSSWQERVPVIFFAWIGFFVSRYLGAYQLEYIDTVWDPFFGDGTRQVLTSDVSKSFPVSDATLGAFSYILDVLMGYAGGTHRWRTMPWVVIIFGILIIPLGVVSITLVILQPVAVGYWCTFCLTSAFISLIMIPFTLDEVLATVQMLRAEKKKKKSLWQTFWFGGTMDGGEIAEKENPEVLINKTLKGIFHDLFTKPWNLYLSIALGAWIMVAPDLLGYSKTIAENSQVTGALIITFSVISMSEVARSVRFINILFGLWIIVAPWILGADQTMTIWISILSGAALVALAFPKGKVEDERGNFNKYVK